MSFPGSRLHLRRKVAVTLLSTDPFGPHNDPQVHCRVIASSVQQLACLQVKEEPEAAPSGEVTGTATPAACSKPAAAHLRSPGTAAGAALSPEAAGGSVHRPRAVTPASAAAAAAAQKKAAADLAAPVADPFEFPVDDSDAQASLLRTTTAVQQQPTRVLQ